jgi:cysteine desulfurase
MTVYLDHAATTPLRPEAREAWVAAASTVGNPSSIHAGGQAARRVVEDARERVAATLGCQPIEVVFTSGGTESINLAIKGLFWARESASAVIVMPDGEHHATLDTVAWLADHEGADVRPVPLDAWGRIEPRRFRDALAGAGLATALVANNEVGTVNDPAALANAAADAGIPLHLDAVAAFGHIPLTFSSWRGAASGTAGLCALSVSAHKIGGPAGVGALVVSRQTEIPALHHGGRQQRGLRSGTVDTAGVAAFAVAAELAEAEREDEARRLRALAGRAVAGIRSVVSEARLLGDPDDRLPGNVHVLFPEVSGETLLFLLDQAGIAVSTGSACQAGVPEPSHVVQALGLSERDARSVVRISLGRTSVDGDVDALLAALPEAHARAAAAAARSRRS